MSYVGTNGLVRKTRRSARLVGASIIALAAGGPCFIPAEAYAQHRRRFEPTDFDLAPTGGVEVDLQMGAVEGESGARVVAPDVEASVSIASRAAIEVDTTYGIDESTHPNFLDNTWLSLRLGVVDWRDDPDDEDRPEAWVLGVQAGPRIPTLPGVRAFGAEGLAIAGRNERRVHVFVQAGAISDSPATDVHGRLTRPFGVEGGIDADVDLDGREVWSLKMELGGTRFFSPHQHELHTTAGFACQVTPWLEVSLIGIAGLLSQGDRYGVLAGVAPSFSLF